MAVAVRMARLAVEDFSGTPLSPVYIAGNVPDAEQAERVLTERGIDYALRLEPFRRDSLLGSILGGTYMGLLFSVPSAERRRSLDALEAEGLTDTLIPDDEDMNHYGA